MGKDKIVTENIIASVIYLILVIITLFTPFGILTLFLLSGPFIFLSLRNENNMFILIFIINIVISFIFGYIVAAFLTILAGSVGFGMGRSYKRNNLSVSILIGTVITLINIVLILILSNILLDVNIANTYNQMLQSSLNSTEDVFNQMSGLQSEQLINQYNEFAETASLLLPFVFIMFSILYAFVNHFSVVKILNKFGFSIPKFPSFRDIVFPRSMIYYYLAVALVYMIGPTNYYLKVVTLNLFPLLTIVLLIQGLSFIFYYSHYKKLGKTLPIIAIITVFIPVLNQIVQVLGIVDLAFNLRKKLK